MEPTRKLRVLHAPTTTGGNPVGLSRTLKQLGVDSTSLTLRDNYLNYPADIVLYKNNYPLPVKELLKIWFIVRIPFRFDLVHYNFGTTIAKPASPVVAGDGILRRWLRRVYSYYSIFLQNLELFYLRLFSIPLFVHYQGTDARQGDYCSRHCQFPITNEPGIDLNEASDRFKRRQIKKICAVCEAVYALNPDLLNVLPGDARFVPYSHIDLSDWPYIGLDEGVDRPLRIGHAPTNRSFKGTRYIEKAVDMLYSEGYEFEFVLIEGLSNEDARDRYKSIDVLVDQLVIGWYGGLAVELMAMGKPVVVYIRDEDLRFLNPEMVADFPFFQANPDTIKTVLEQVLALSRKDLAERGRRSRAYVEKWHDPLAIAAEIKLDYEKSLDKRAT